MATVWDLALGDDADAEAAEAGERDAEAVVGGEAFDLDAGSDGVFCGARGRDRRTMISPSVRTPSTSKMRTLMLRARASAERGILR